MVIDGTKRRSNIDDLLDKKFLTIYSGVYNRPSVLNVPQSMAGVPGFRRIGKSGSRGGLIVKIRGGGRGLVNWR